MARVEVLSFSCSATSTAGGLQTMFETAIMAVAGPKGIRPGPDRGARGTGRGSVTLGVAGVVDPAARARSTDRYEVPLASLEHFAADDLLSQVVMERMLPGSGDPPACPRDHCRTANPRAPGAPTRVRDSAAMEATEIRKLATLEDTHWWYAERRALLAHEIEGITPGVALDIGAAGGGNTRVLRAHGWRATALEYSQDGAEVARDRGIPVIRADGCALPLASGSLDLVVAFDVLEHIADDKSAASEIARVLAPGGTALVAVPADPRLWSAHDEAVGHVRRYTRETLTATLASAGLTLVRMRSWNVLLRPIVAWRRKRSTGSDLERLPATVNLGLRAIVAVERYLPVGRLSGVSLIARVRRP